MSTPVATPSSEWRRMTNKINTVLKTSTRTNDYPRDIMMSASETTDIYHQEIQAITDYRQFNGSEQYLVSWHCPSKASWECEQILEVICKEALLKFWMKIVLSERDDVLNITNNTEVNSSIKNNFSKKLRHWMSQPLTNKKGGDDVKEYPQLLGSLTPPKKRPRRITSDDESSDFLTIEKKYKKLSEETNENKTVSAASIDVCSAPMKIQINKDLDLYNVSGPLKPNEIFDLVDAPQYEVGEVITWNKNVDDDSQPNSYLVSWHYVSNETTDTLGITEDLLQKHFGPSSLEEGSQKFQLRRKKHGSATIREVPNRKKSYSPHSDSDQSESSTVPPSEFGMYDMTDYRVLTDQVSDVACQTLIEFDPFACTYCRSRKGEEERLSSLRHRKGEKKENQDDEKEAQKNAKKGSGTGNSDGADDEDDDDLVSIEYEIEKILNYRMQEGTNVDEYYIRWKGFTSHYDTWEPFENLSSCDKALITFYVDRVAERRLAEEEIKKMTASGNSAAVRKLNKPPPLPPIPEILMEKLSKAAPVTDEEIEMAFKVSKTIRKNARWSKKKLRKMLLDLIGEAVGPGSSTAISAAYDELPVIRHQLLMLESERRKELILKDLKEWECLLNKIARGRPEIVVENNYDLAGPPSDFKYINDNVLGDGVTFPDDPLEGCDCEDSCVKDKSQCCPGKHGKVLAYNSYKRLRVYPGYPIYECNKRCKCGPECANRVVQDGTISLIGTKLCIFRTSNERGWGVKTLKKIKRGTFVCLYAGEIITSEEAENRGQIYENQLGACYLFDLDYYAGDDDSCPYTIDATKMGNIAHFINHSCDPNLCVFNVWADCVDQNLPKLAFFALRDINKDEELTYDYGTQDDDPLTGASAPLPVMAVPEITEGDEESDENLMLPLTSSPSKNRLKPATTSGVRRPCLCGASSCRKVLF